LRYKNCSSKWKDSVISKRVDSEVKKARLDYELDLVHKASKNPKILYNYINSQQSVKDSIKALKRQDGEITHDQKEIADILNTNFQDVFVREDDGQLPSFESRTNETFNMVPQDIKYEDVLNRLKNLEENKSCGVDKLHPTLLKNCASAFAIPLTLIFMESFEKGPITSAI
jgi:hypothetical protein